MLKRENVSPRFSARTVGSRGERQRDHKCDDKNGHIETYILSARQSCCPRTAGAPSLSSYAASLANSIGSIIEGSSFSGLLTRVDMGHMRIRPAGNGRIRSLGSGSSLSHRV
jgi:hypothetical protein